MTVEHPEGRDWAVALVHGIGHTEPVEMLKLVTDAVGTQRPMHLEPDVRVFLPLSEQPLIATAPAHEPAPNDAVRQHVWHGRIGNASVRVATAFWSDVSMFGEGLIRLIGNMALGGMGVRYLADAGSGARNVVARALHAVLTLKIVLLALGFLPIVLCTLFFSLSALTGYYLFRNETLFLQSWAIPVLALAAITWLVVLARRMLWPMRDQRSLALPIFNALWGYGALMAGLMLVGHRRTFGQFLPTEQLALCMRDNPPEAAINVVEASVRWLMAWYGQISGNVNWQDRVCLLDETGIYIGFLQLLQYVCGFLVICLTAVVLLLLLVALVPFVATREQRRGMLLGAVGVTTMWLLMLLVLWPENVLTATVLNLYLAQKQGMPEATLSSIFWWKNLEIKSLAGVREYMPLIWFDIFFTILLVGVTLLAWWLMLRRHGWARAHASGEGEALLARLKPPLAADARWGPRLLLATSYQVAIILFMIVISGTALAHYFKFDKWHRRCRAVAEGHRDLAP